MFCFHHLETNLESDVSCERTQVPIWRPANVLNKRSRTAEKLWSSNIWIQELHQQPLPITIQDTVGYCTLRPIRTCVRRIHLSEARSSGGHL